LTFQIWQNYPAVVGFITGAGFGKSARFRPEPEPKFGTAL